MLQIFADGVAAGATEAVMEMSLARAGPGAGLGRAGGRGDLHQPDAGPPGLPRHDGGVRRGEGDDCLRAWARRRRASP